MRLWIAVHLPHLALEAFVPRGQLDLGYAVIDQEKVVSVSTAAREAGIRYGMRRGAVTMIAPQVVMLDRHATRESDALAAVALAMLQYTPLVADGGETVLLLDVGASLNLFQGPRALCRRIHTDMLTLGVTAQVSTAPTAQGAWLLAKGKSMRRRTLKTRSMQLRIDQLPAVLVPPARRFADWLDGLGCTTISELRRLPRPGLQRRCGRELLDVLDAAYGYSPELYEWIESPETFRGQVEIFDRVEKADELLIGAHRLVLQLVGWLCSRQLAVRKIRLEMQHERGRSARPPSFLDVALADAVWQDTHIIRLLKERLASLQLEAPVIGLVLEAVDLAPMDVPSESLFPDPGGTDADRRQLLELLTARLGADNVLQPAPRADYRPEVANEWAPASIPLRKADVQAQLPAEPGQFPRPSWILAKPIPLLVRQDRPFYGSPLKTVSTPERIEAGWWSSTECRDYFIAEGADHSLYWIYRERVTTKEGEPEVRWHLHGLFG